jgi:hypothetical protein
MRPILLALLLLVPVCGIAGCGAPTSDISITQIPYRTRVVLKTGEDAPFGSDAAKFILPEGQTFAVWVDAEKQKQRARDPLSVARSPRVNYGSAPLNPDYYATADDVRAGKIAPPDDGQKIVIADFKIWVGQDRRLQHDEWAESYLFMGKWQLCVIEDLDAYADIPVTVVVMPRQPDWQIIPVPASPTAN